MSSHSLHAYIHRHGQHNINTDADLNPLSVLSAASRGILASESQIAASSGKEKDEYPLLAWVVLATFSSHLTHVCGQAHLQLDSFVTLTCLQENRLVHAHVHDVALSSAFPYHRPS